MELIIRVTGRCNFDCSFCCAGGLDIGHPSNGVPVQIKDVIQKIRPTSIVISGGEPLMVDPSYYLELYEISQCNISITSNLKEFYYHPDRWKEVLSHPHIGVITSFNYGDTRKWNSNTVYTEEKFIEIYNLYKKVINRPLMFIAVLDESNEDTVLDLVRLAKRLGTCVRINNATTQGRQTSTYPRYKLFQKYFEIIEAGYGDYEVYCRNPGCHKCPINADGLCDSTIRTCYVDSKNQLHYYGCCESRFGEIPLNPDDDVIRKPATHFPTIDQHINSKCACCELFPICNGCWSQKVDYPPEHCEEMLNMKEKFIEYGWVRL